MSNLIITNSISEIPPLKAATDKIIPISETKTLNSKENWDKIYFFRVAPNAREVISKRIQANEYITLE